MLIALEPLDTLFFRDGKPFVMGEGTWADTMNFPFPSVFYGALRSTYFAEHLEIFAKLVKEKALNTKEDPTINLKITALYYELIGKRGGLGTFLPLPCDLVQLKKRGFEEKNREKQEFTYNVIPLIRYQEGEAACGIKNLHFHVSSLFPLIHHEEVNRVQAGLISLVDYNNYYRTAIDLGNIYARSACDHIITEPKVGIARNRQTHSAKEHYLYRVTMNRYRGLRLIIQYKGLDIPVNGLMKFGGEGKAVSYWEYKKSIIVEPGEVDRGFFKLYLATPAVFKQGWLPDGLDSSSLSGSLNGIKVKLLAAALGKELHAGGFDMARKKPKPMRRAVPAGSVYYLQAIDNTSSSGIIEAFHGKPLISGEEPVEYHRGLGQQGFGITYLATLK